MAEFTRDDVIEKVRSHISLEFADLRGLDLRGIDFRKANLSGAEMTDTRLNGSRLGSANLQKTKLFEADMTTVDLSGANLAGANLQKAILVGANLSHALLQGATLRFADLSGATLAHADMTGADLVRAKCRESDFREAILTDADLSSAFFRGALLRGANLVGANIEGAVGLDPTLTNATMGMPMLDLTQRGGRRPGPATLGYGAGTGPESAGTMSGTTSGTPGGIVKSRVAKMPKPSKYHAELRRVPSVIFTPNGWIRGVFHVPVMHGFLEHLNLAGDFFKLTDVTLPDLKLDLKFFGLRRSKALIVLPDCDPKILALPQITADYTVHRVSFLMEGGTVTGSLAIEEDIRLSDYLTNHDHFVVLKNCRFGAYDTNPDEDSRFPFLLVNTAGVIGGSDEKLDG
ncbi:MAG: pentapeptide repeat-containing protein [Acidobacteria bacterium]|nr:pentapeptide repeat-containing protein [Acidobacteriota bacterium]